MVSSEIKCLMKNLKLLAFDQKAEALDQKDETFEHLNVRAEAT